MQSGENLLNKDWCGVFRVVFGLLTSKTGVSKQAIFASLSHMELCGNLVSSFIAIYMYVKMRIGSFVFSDFQPFIFRSSD